MATLHLFDIPSLDTDLSVESKWPSIYEIMTEDRWHFVDDQVAKRMGILNALRMDGVIAGFFAQEGEKQGFQYDNEKKPIASKPFLSFEHLFFALFEDTNQLLLQSKNIYGYSDLNLPFMRIGLLRVLTDIFREAGVYIPKRKDLQIESAEIVYSQTDLYEAFKSFEKVFYLEVDNLDKNRIPAKTDPRYILFNPKAEWNEITWGAVSESIEAGMEQAIFTSSDSPDSTLKSPISKAFAGAGEIQEVSGLDSSQNIRLFKRKNDFELEIDIPITPSLSPELISQIASQLDEKGRKDAWAANRKKRIDNATDGTLFEE